MGSINLFEYQNKESYEGEFEGLEAFLDDVWKNREKSGYSFGNKTQDETQRFINFFHNTKELKSTKYVGVIHFEGKQINLLPKIFHQPNKEPNLCGIQNHILWWLSYCRKIKFPNYKTALDHSEDDFFEVLIYLFAKYTLNLLGNTLYQQYEQVNEELSFVKGRIDMNRYINVNLTKARWHKVSCSFDAFEFDNKFNRIIKFVCKQLLPVAKQSANRQKLREILFILDDVADEPATADDCSRIAFNPMFEDFATVRDYCYLFLKNSISLSHNNKLQLFAFLLPMEYVFEDFIYGFIDQEIESIKANAQNMSKSLDKSELFKLRPDLMLQYGDKRIIADTKCKIIYNNDSDPKNGLSQSDLYQMVAYAIRFELTDIVLFYPDTVGKYVKDIFELTIPDDLAGKEINIKAFQVPIINKEVIEGNDSPGATLGELFTVTKQALITRINEVLLID
jgi:5-methylcytosine-specific restriction enzyme subunit McrC